MRHSKSPFSISINNSDIKYTMQRRKKSCRISRNSTKMYNSQVLSNILLGTPKAQAKKY